MQIKDFMSRDVDIVPPDTAMFEVAQRMRKNDCGCVLVSDEDKLVGIITDRDIAIRCVAEEHNPVQIRAAEVMAREILYCKDTDDAQEVARGMALNKVRRLIVLDAEQRMVGTVALGDISIPAAGGNTGNHKLNLTCHPTLVSKPVLKNGKETPED